ncbi:MAG TPA: GGDEF domain-containing protein [Solirubrobacteraceae bacterium]|jgi:diguanylate cyclase (GGDEF)-like protein
MVSTVRSIVDARRASVFFALAGALAIVNAWVPGICPAAQRPTFTLLGLLDIAVAGVVVALPWHRWPRRALVAIPVLALLIVDLFAIVGRLGPWIYTAFLLLVAIWVGLSLPRWSLVSMAPVVAAAYVLPLLVNGRGHDAAVSVGVVVPIAVVVGEVLAREITRLRDASLRDDLTGLGNRREGIAALERLRPGDAVLLLDLDRFKDVNDRYGHAAGDAVLASLGRLLGRSLRRADTAARLGGEEFVVVADQVGAAAGELADRLCEAWRGTGPRTTLSIGVSVHAEGDSPERTLARADAALYAAKRDGRDRVSYAGG